MVKRFAWYAPLAATLVSAIVVLLVAAPWRDAAASLSAAFLCLIGLCAYGLDGIEIRRIVRMALWQALLLIVAIVILISSALAVDMQHTLWGFAFDSTSAAFVLVALLMAATLPALQTRARILTAVVAVLVLIGLWTIPLFRTNPEVRPSFAATMHVALEASSAGGIRQMALGAGPNSFVYLWQRHAPTSVSSSVFAAERFPVGSGILPTFVTEIGILPTFVLILAFLVRAVECFERALQQWRTLGRAARARETALATFPLIALAGLLFAPPSAPLLLSAFVALGASGGRVESNGMPPTQSSRILGKFGVVVISIAAAGIVYLAIAAMLYFYAGALSTQGDLLRARNAATRSYLLSGDPQAARLSASILRTLAHETAKRKTIQEVPPLYAEALGTIRSATVREPSYADNWSLFGAIAAEQYTATRDASYFEIARGALERARLLAPGDARIPLFQGQLYLLAGRLDDGIRYLEESVELRPDTQEAVSLLASARQAKEATGQ